MHGNRVKIVQKGIILLCKAVCLTYFSLYEMSRVKFTACICICFMDCNTQLLVFRFSTHCKPLGKITKVL